MGETQVMGRKSAGLIGLQRTMVKSAMAILIFTCGVVLLKSDFSKKAAPAAVAQEEDRGETDENQIDQLAKAKIEVLKSAHHAASKDGAGAIHSADSSRASDAILDKTRYPKVSTAVAFNPQSASADAMKRLIQIRKCERLSIALQFDVKSECPMHHPQAKEAASGYSDLLIQQTVGELAFLKQLAIYARSENQPDPFDLAQVAKAYVQHSDDNVKEQALAIAALLSDRDGKDALTVAIKAIQTTDSGPLTTQALALLDRHRDIDVQSVDRTIKSALENGSWNVREAVATRLLPFITPSTKAEFNRILASEPVRSKVALHIRLNLEEFDRMERL